MMDASELAKMMLQWEQLRMRLDDLEDAIRYDVLKMEKTQTVGNVRATYSKGRKRYDYAQAVSDEWNRATDADDAGRENLITDLRSKHEKITCDNRAICKELDISVPFTQGDPSVSIKLVS